jgi:hypothetical protein
MDYAHVTKADIDLTTVGAHALSVVAAVCKGLKRAGNSPEVVEEIRADMMSGDYDHLLQVAIAVTE